MDFAKATMSSSPAVKRISKADFVDIADDRFRDVANRWLDVTLLSVERLYSLYLAVQQIASANVPGAVVECGTFKGGSAGFILDTLVEFSQSHRPVFLFDTFDGFPDDVSELLITGDTFVREDWITDSFLNEFIENINKSRYPFDSVNICRGKVQDTIPDQAPEQIALCHLDTDYHGATKHQLNHLYPRLSSGGLLQIDDYGHFLGCRKAVDEYFARDDVVPMFLARIDYTGRVGVKV